MARVPGNPLQRGPASGLDPEDVDMAMATLFKPDTSAEAFKFTLPKTEAKDEPR